MQLQWVIQTLFSWKDAHLHVFETEDGLSLDIDFPEYSFLVSEGDWEQSAESQWSGTFPLAKCLKKVGLFTIFIIYGSVAYIGLPLVVGRS